MTRLLDIEKAPVKNNSLQSVNDFQVPHLSPQLVIQISIFKKKGQKVITMLM